MLQEIYCEITDAAQDLAEKVAPNASTTEKEAIADAAVEKAEKVADAVAYSEEIDEVTYDALVETIAQCIYAETLGQLAVNQSCYALQEMFGDNRSLGYKVGDVVRGSINGKGKKILAGSALGGAAGAGAGYVLAKRTGKNKTKLAIVGGLAGTAVGGAVGYKYGDAKAYLKGKKYKLGQR